MDMLEIDQENTQVERPPRTATVLVFLAAGAIIVAYLVVYAATNALIAADIMTEFPREADPRPQWLLRAFIGMFVAFAGMATIFRWLSHRQLRRIDAMSEA